MEIMKESGHVSYGGAFYCINNQEAELKLFNMETTLKILGQLYGNELVSKIVNSSLQYFSLSKIKYEDCNNSSNVSRACVYLYESINDYIYFNGAKELGYELGNCDYEAGVSKYELVSDYLTIQKAHDEVNFLLPLSFDGTHLRCVQFSSPSRSVSYSEPGFYMLRWCDKQYVSLSISQSIEDDALNKGYLNFISSTDTVGRDFIESLIKAYKSKKSKLMEQKALELKREEEERKRRLEEEKAREAEERKKAALKRAEEEAKRRELERANIAKLTSLRDNLSKKRIDDDIPSSFIDTSLLLSMIHSCIDEAVNNLKIDTQKLDCISSFSEEALKSWLKEMLHEGFLYGGNSPKKDGAVSKLVTTLKKDGEFPMSFPSGYNACVGKSGIVFYSDIKDKHMISAGSGYSEGYRLSYIIKNSSNNSFGDLLKGINDTCLETLSFIGEAVIDYEAIERVKNKTILNNMKPTNLYFKAYNDGLLTYSKNLKDWRCSK